MLREDRPPNSFVSFLDSIRNHTIKRAAETANWNDVWVAALNTPAYAETLLERGINTDNLKKEIQLITNFPHYHSEDTGTSALDLRKKALRELSREVRSVHEFIQNKETRDEKGVALGQVYKILSDKINNTMFHQVTEDADAIQVAEIKQKILVSLLAQITAFVADEKMPDGKRRIIGIDKSKDLVVEIDNRIEDKILEGLTLTLSGLLINPEMADFPEDLSPLTIMESLRENPLIEPPKSVVIDTLIAESGPFYKQLLHRNGLPSADVEYVDPLAKILPELEIQSILTSAYEEALSSNSRTLAPRHLALALLNEIELSLHFRNLGIKDLMEFSDKVAYAAKKIDDRGTRGVRVRTQISYGIYPLLERLNEIYKKEENAIPLLWHLIKTDKEVDQLFNRAGLTRDMLKEWPKKYREVKEDEEKAKKAGKGAKNSSRLFFQMMFDPPRNIEGPYTIPDSYLEDLIRNYCIDYTALAKKKKFDPMIGNEKVMDEVMTILQKRGKKNPLLIGEPGIGKSKILEGLAIKIQKGDVPKPFFGARVLALDLGSMNDSPFRGVFEERVTAIAKGISERNAHGKLPPVFLAIDELGENMEAGAGMKSTGFKGLIKPYLTSGDLYVIANTTREEYNTRIEKDAAFARRFQPVELDEPSVEETTNILLGQKTKYSAHHKIRIPNHLMEYIADSAGHYIHTVKQPDKSIDILDQACSIARNQGAKTLQKEHINLAVSAKSGIPLSYLSQNDRDRYAVLEHTLGKKVFDQPEALAEVSGALKRARAGLRDTSRPIGNFIFVGPTGVGKTELSKAVAEFMVGSSTEGFLNRFDMGEFQEKHAASALRGAAPGYVGYDEGGKIIKAVRNHPYSVNLFDEAEKAHPDIFNTLLAPLSSGIMTDGRGVTADFKNTVNIFTVNLGAQEVMDTAVKRGLDPLRDYEEWQKMARPIYERHVKSFFTPEFLNRMDGVIFFNSLRKETLAKLVKREFERTAGQVKGQYQLDLSVAQPFMDAVALKGFDIRYGARPLKREWQKTVETPLSDWVLRQSNLSLKKGTAIEMTTGTAPEENKGDGVVVPISSVRKKPVANDGELKPAFVLRTGTAPS